MSYRNTTTFWQIASCQLTSGYLVVVVSFAVVVVVVVVVTVVSAVKLVRHDHA